MSAAPQLDLDSPLDEAALAPETPLRRTRKRPPPIRLSESDAATIVARVKTFAQQSEDDRDDDKRYREQRYAKLMQWSEPRNEPWEGATSVTLPDLMTACLRSEDSLSNAVLQTRPPVSAKSMDPIRPNGERKVDLLLDAQFFVEQDGEKLVESMVSDFCRDGTLTVYVRQVTERRTVSWVHDYEPLGLAEVPEKRFRKILDQRFRTQEIRKLDDEGWDWKVRDLDGNDLDVRFYTAPEDESVQMEIRSKIVVFDGPAVMVVPYEDLLHPYWCENLQAPSPSNPRGAEYVILRDYPTLDEVGRLIDAQVYDRIQRSDTESQSPNPFQNARDDHSLERQKDTMRGFSETSSQTPSGDTANQGRTLRYICFDLWARDGTGESQDVVWTVLPEYDLLARAVPLSEMVPGNPPRRPFAEGVFIPIQKRRIGIGIPELGEGLHDFKTHVFNQMGDACDMEIQPFFTYKPSSQINPEVYELAPGSGLPQQNAGDINFARIQPTATAIAINEITLADQMFEKLLSQGDLQFGRVPAGKSAALRTSGGIQQLLQQGEARPERILRRFFLCLKDTFALMHQLNCAFLPPKKRFRLIGVGGPDDDPFQEIDAREDLSGTMHFDFEANVLNTSKAALQQSLGEALQLALNPLMLQLGISTPDTIYRLTREYMRSLGQTDRYLHPPTSESSLPQLQAADAMTAILQGRFPIGVPAEDPEAHLQAIQQLLQSPTPGGYTLQETLLPLGQQLLQSYLQSVQQRIQAQAQQQQMMQNAQQLLQQRQAGGSQPGPAGGSSGGLGMVSPNEMMDESLPDSGTPQ